MTPFENFGKAHREVVALYLFGSEATGRAGPLSDLDVAVLLDGVKSRSKDRFRLRLDLIGQVMGLAKRSDVDLLLLNEATPLLAYEVVRSGRLLYERDHAARVEFEARTVGHYLDLEPFYRVSRAYLKRQLLGKGSRGQP